MSRPNLRLVQPLSADTSLPELPSDNEKTEWITDPQKVQNILSLFLQWPDYSSAILIAGDKRYDIKIEIDTELRDVEQLFGTIPPTALSTINPQNIRSYLIHFEVFGLAYRFEVDQMVTRNDHHRSSDLTPNLIFNVPTKIQRMAARTSRRIPLENPLPVVLTSDHHRIEALLVEVSPKAFRFEIIQKGKDLPPLDRVKVQTEALRFDMRYLTHRQEHLILGPYPDEQENFKYYFELFLKYAHPTLRPRYSFAEDPVPLLAEQSGQIDKYAKDEFPPDVDPKKILHENYLMASQMPELKLMEMVAIDPETNQPVGSSSVSRAFKTSDTEYAWCLYGLNIIPSPKYFEQSCALYTWSADYLSHFQGDSIVMWYDSKTRWTNKLFTKLKHFIREGINIDSVRLTRYSRTLTIDVSHRSKERTYYYKDGVVGAFNPPYLHVAGGLDTIYPDINSTYKGESKHIIADVLKIENPERYTLASVTNNSIDYLEFENYTAKTTIPVNTQFSSLIGYFINTPSSIEHITALARRKHNVL